MRRWSIVVILVSTAGVLHSQAPKSRSAPQSAIARGKYIVDHVSKCGDCHTPRDDKGQPIGSRYLRGGDLGVEPIAQNPAFTRTAPDISAQGLIGWSVADLTKAFQAGKRPSGEMFRPPMPAYTMNQQDAEAVAIYLKSVK